jgi:hypothetical protein
MWELSGKREGARKEVRVVVATIWRILARFGNGERVGSSGVVEIRLESADGYMSY